MERQWSAPHTERIAFAMALALRGRLAVALLLATPAIPFVAPHAHAESAAQACYKKFNAERKTGTIKGQTYKDFKATQCGTSDAAAATPAATAPAEQATPSVTTPPPTAPVTPSRNPASIAATAAAGSAVLPTAISPKYASEKPGKARMHTCLDQYNANKATNANGGLVWIKKGGGYYSVCNAHLKS
ncbi:hypothetical protein AA12717_2751 [Gluconacetobacter sacchari DSM 12717]|nr:hypothetical protein AA12717_2751 [Gluconacetobacter sacchari DSM 12717]